MTNEDQKNEDNNRQGKFSDIQFVDLVVSWLLKYPSVLLSVFSAYLVWISRSYTDAYLRELGAGIGWFDYNLFDQLFFSYPAIGLTCIIVVLIVTLDVLSLYRDRKGWWLCYVLWLAVAYSAFVTSYIEIISFYGMKGWAVNVFWASGLIWLGLPWFRDWLHRSRVSKRLAAARTAGKCQGLRDSGITPEIATEMAKSKDVAVRQEAKRLLSIFAIEHKSNEIYNSVVYAKASVASTIFGLSWLVWISWHTASLQGQARAIRTIDQVEFRESLRSSNAIEGACDNILFNSGSNVLVRVFNDGEWGTQYLPSSSARVISVK